MQNINNYNALFELDDRITYLNCASMSPLLKSVKQAGIQGLEKRSKPWGMTDHDWFDDAEILRVRASKIFQTSEDNIAIIPSASYGLATAAKSISKSLSLSKVKTRKSIIVIEDQFPSNYYIWENLSKQLDIKLITIKKLNDKILTDSILESINSDTSIVAIPNCHWIDGSLIELEKISKAAKAVNAYLILDLSQSLGVLPTNISKIDPDFAIAVGYKWLLGPYCLGYMYVSPKWHEEGEPLEYNWGTRKGSNDFSSLINYTPEYRKGARKFDMGEFSQFNTMPMAIAALDQILKWGIENIQFNIKKLTNIMEKNINQNKISYAQATPRVGHIISVPISSIETKSLRQKISEKNIKVSFRGPSIRVSPHLYNDISDINKLIDCII